MKKVVAVMLAGIMLLLCACGDSKNDDSSRKKEESSISDVDKLKEANENAKILFTKVNNLIFDYELDYKGAKLSDIDDCMNNLEIELKDLKNSSNPFDNALYKVLTEGEYISDEKLITSGKIYFSIEKIEYDGKTDYLAMYAQWADSKESDNGIIGQYPNSELDSSIGHKMGKEFVPGEYQTEH